MNGNSSVFEKLTRSKVYQDYERAFSGATGLAVSLRPLESWQLPLRGKTNANRFCALMAGKSRSCAACLQVQQRLSDSARQEAQTVTCYHGLSDTAVPVHLGEEFVGFLQTGQIFRRKPTQAQFERTAGLMAQWGLPVNHGDLKDAYFSTRVLSTSQHTAVVDLLKIAAQHLSITSNQIVIQEQNSEPPAILRAKEYIKANQAEPLSLGKVAKSVNMSMHYFCKSFKKSTGINFTEYLARVRVEKAKNLLLNPNLRISEIGYEVGFQSLTHFNRLFKRILGKSPTTYRKQLIAK